MGQVIIVRQGSHNRLRIAADKNWADVELVVGPDGDSCLAEFETDKLARATDKIRTKPSRLETLLFDALENLICQIYADGPTLAGESRGNRALVRYTEKYGQRHDGKWEGVPVISFEQKKGQGMSSLLPRGK